MPHRPTQKRSIPLKEFAFGEEYPEEYSSEEYASHDYSSEYYNGYDSGFDTKIGQRGRNEKKKQNLKKQKTNDVQVLGSKCTSAMNEFFAQEVNLFLKLTLNLAEILSFYE